MNTLYTLNLTIGWLGILLGLSSGALIGLFFHREDWFEGYGSWRRRMLRLGHISFIGIALLNFAFVFSANQLNLYSSLRVASAGFAMAEVTMPSVCFVSAFWKPARYAFPVPVVALFVGTIVLVVQGLLQ